MDELRRIGLAAAALAVALLACVGTALGYHAYANLVESSRAPEPVLTESIEGLPDGVALDTEPNSVQDGFAVFDDRAVKLFETDQETLTTCIDAQRTLLVSVPEGVNTYLVVAPTRVSFESSLQEVSQDETAIIAQAYDGISNTVTCIDVVPTLRAHAGEYLYYRTEPQMTFLGSYWVSRDVLAACGLEGIDISEYRPDSRRSLSGSYSSQFGLSEYPDAVTFYTHPDLPNRATISTREDDGTGSDPYSAPALAVSRGGGSIALGSYLSYAVIEGADANGRTLLVVGSDEAKSLCTWLVSSFDRIVYVDQDWTVLTASEFREFFDTYEVTDFLLYQSTDALSLGNGNSSLRELAGEG